MFAPTHPEVLDSPAYDRDVLLTLGIAAFDAHDQLVIDERKLFAYERKLARARVIRARG